MRSLKWAAPAALVAAVLALSACGGGGMNPTPGAGQSFGAQRVAGEKHITTQMVHTNAKCPTLDNLGCFTDSLGAGGLDITWCYGPTSDPCEDTDQISWSGGVVLTKTLHGVGKSKMKGTWTGPFPCTSSTCGSSGSYELDTITNGKKLTEVKAYKYSQNVCIDSSCGTYYIGLNVGP
jgi:hypothetical protein